MPLDQDRDVSEEVVDAIETQPGPAIRNITRVSARPGFSGSYVGQKRNRRLHIKLLRAVRDDAFKAQEAETELRGVIRYIALLELKNPLSTGERFLAIREMQEQTLAKSWSTVTASESPQSLQLRSLVLRNVLSGISSLHAIRVVHGDIKPDNVALLRSDRSAEIMDFGSTIPAHTLHENELAYRDPVTPGKLASDIYSFGTLARDLYSNLRLNDETAISGFTVRQLFWLTDILRSDNWRDRPPADVLVGLLFDRHRLAHAAEESVRDVGNDLLRMLNRRNADLISLVQLEQVRDAVVDRTWSAFAAHPETMIFAQRGQRLLTLMANLPIDVEDNVTHTHKHQDDSAVPSEYLKDLPDEIDPALERSLERDVRRSYGTADSDVVANELAGARDFSSRSFDLASVGRACGCERSWSLDLPGLPVRPDHGSPVSGGPGGCNPVLSWWLTPQPRLDDMAPAEALQDDDMRPRIASIFGEETA